MATALTESWVVVNDSVMGGVSSSEILFLEEGFNFSGVVSKENNGGFASIRKNISADSFVSSTGISIQGEGENLRYQVVVWIRGYGPRLYYRHDFYPTGKPQFLSYANFEAVSFGRQVAAPPLMEMRQRASSIGILMGAGYEGPFQLEVQRVELEYGMERASSPQMVASIVAAIEAGAPVFNAGNAAGCADIYHQLIESFLEEDLSLDYKKRLQAVLETAGTVEDPVARAWLLRRTLDEMLAEG